MIEIAMKNWVMLGLLMGSFWGFIAMFLYSPQSDMKWGKPWFAWNNIRNIVVFVNQFSFNFVGAFSGVVCLKLLYIRIQQGAFDGFDLALLIFSILGLSGKLSAIIWELPYSVSGLIQSLASRLIK